MAEVGFQVDVVGWAALAEDEGEKNAKLQWPESLDVYDQMRREDSQVTSVLRAVTLPIRSARWLIDPAGASDEVVALVAEDLGLPVKGREVVAPVRSRGRFSWSEHLRLALLSLVYGHSFFEQVYQEQDGKQRLHKLAWRPPRSITEIHVARDGGLVGIKQEGVEQVIGVDRLVAYVNEREGGIWSGQSVLRSAYKNWLLKDRILRSQALTIDRNGLGVPLYEGAPAPEKAKAEERKEWTESEMAAGLAVAKSFRGGESAGLSIPNGAAFKLQGVTGTLPDTEKPIRYHDEQIARAVLAHFLNLGTETGSWALGSTFADFFTQSLNAVAGYVVDVAQQHVIEDLVDLNFGEDVSAPRLVCEPIGSEAPATAEAVKSLIDSGAVKPDAALESFVRAKFGLPAAVPVDPDGGDGVAAVSDLERARAIAEVAQKVYLSTDKVVLNQDEARDIVAMAGADLSGEPPATQRVPDAGAADPAASAE